MNGQSVLARYAMFPLRLILGFGFAYHGFPKLFTSAGHAFFAGMLSQIGVPAVGLASWLIAALEFCGGLALIAGAFVPLVAVLCAIEMFVALFTVHLSQGFNFLHITGMTAQGPQFGMPGFEVNLLYIGGLLALLLAGAGPLSVDSWRARHRRRREPVPDRRAEEARREEPVSVD